MFKKYALVIICFLGLNFTLTIFTQNLDNTLDNNCCFENNNVSTEKIKNKDLLIKLDESLFEYYKNNQWVFLENVFIDFKASLWYKIKFVTKKYLSISGTSLGVGAATFLICGILGADKEANVFISGVTIALTFGLTSFYFKKYFDYYLERKILKDFLKNYFIDSKINYNFNYRDLVPEELKSSFDNLKKEFDKNGDSVFRKFGSKLVKQIREDIIYKKNPNKYFKPTVYVENIK